MGQPQQAMITGKAQEQGEGRRSRGRPTLDDAARIEERLLAAALEEFLDSGYGGASLSKVVRAAGISKTTLYSRFHSKEALFRAIMERQVEKLAAATTLTSPDGLLDLAQGLENYANRSLEMSLSGDLLAVNRLIFSEAHRFPELGMAAAERAQLGIAQIAWFIEQCALRDDRPVPDCRATAEVFIYMLRGWYVNAMLANRAVSADERRAWVARAVPAFIGGLGA